MIDLRDRKTWPQEGTEWKHYNGNRYVVVFHTNVDNGPQWQKYPPTIVYRNVFNGKLFSRPVAEWERSFTPAE